MVTTIQICICAAISPTMNMILLILVMALALSITIRILLQCQAIFVALIHQQDQGIIMIRPKVRTEQLGVRGSKWSLSSRFVYICGFARLFPSRAYLFDSIHQNILSHSWTVRYLPAWFLGAGSRKTAALWAQSLVNMVEQ
jgi:hypothetical protein